MRLLTCLKFSASMLFCVLALNAQATRTWVSGVGDDANPCSRTAPCKTFAGAISKTAAGGEIDALDPGGFGVVTITKAITIDGGATMASILGSGTNGVVVSAGVSDSVILRNLSIDGARTGTNGVRFLSGKALRIENCTILGFTQRGIDVSVNNVGGVLPPQVFVINTTVSDSNDGIRSSLTQRALVDIVNSRFVNNTNSGIYAGDFARFSINGSDASGNGVAGVIALANAGDVGVNLLNSTVANNSDPSVAAGTGIQAGGGTNVSVIRIASVMITSNFPNGMVVGSNGQIVSFGQNVNTGSGAPTSTLARQ